MALYCLHLPAIRLPGILAAVQSSTHSRFIGVEAFPALVNSPLIDAGSRRLLQRRCVCRIR